MSFPEIYETHSPSVSRESSVRRESIEAFQPSLFEQASLFTRIMMFSADYFFGKSQIVLDAGIGALTIEMTCRNFSVSVKASVRECTERLVENILNRAT